jgi:3-hydroxybutyryl-CoA dehydrogenase
MIEKVAVVGAGQMGAGIAQVAAMNGFSVILSDIKDVFLDNGIQRIQKSLSSFAKKDRITEEEKDAALARIQTTLDIQAFDTADYVVEAVIENESLKLEVFGQLDAICRPETVLASNTSSIPITRIAAATKRPEKVIGMHFMNPVPLMKLVEIIRGLATSDETFDTTKDLAVALKKTPVAANDSHAHDQRSRLCFVRRRGNSRSHRFRHEAGDEPSHGTSGIGGFDWSGHLSVHHGSVATRIRRFQIQALSSLEKVC